MTKEGKNAVRNDSHLVRDLPTMFATGSGNQGSIPEREHEKPLPHPRKYACLKDSHFEISDTIGNCRANL